MIILQGLHCKNLKRNVEKDKDSLEEEIGNSNIEDRKQQVRMRS